MDKPYHLMTPAERLAARIAKNREITERVSEAPVKPAKATSARGSRKAVTGDDVAIAARQSAVRNQLDQFQKIKNAQGIDAASDFILSRIKK
jgi:hypothetical protein